jgi:hypothetical protein
MRTGRCGVGFVMLARARAATVYGRSYDCRTGTKKGTGKKTNERSRIETNNVMKAWSSI